PAAHMAAQVNRGEWGGWAAPGHRRGVKGLKEQGAQPTDEHGGIGVHPPDRTVLAEPARPRRLVDARPVGAPIRPGNHAEQAATQGPAHDRKVGEGGQPRHATDGTRNDRVVLGVVAPAVLTADVGTASAQGATLLTFAQTFRRCDHSTNTDIGPTGFARPTAMLRSTGAEVIAVSS